MAEHPGIDGYCYFNQTGFWVTPLPRDPDFVEYAKVGILGLRGPLYRGKDQGPLITYNFEGRTITTYMDSSHYSYDDLYGYSLGYLQGQGLDPELVKNSSQWVTISRQKCLDIQAKYNFQNEALLFLKEFLFMLFPFNFRTSCFSLSRTGGSKIDCPSHSVEAA